MSDDEDDFIEVIIDVRNEEEPGVLTLSTIAPFIYLVVTAEFSDPDGNLRDVTWVWERSPDGEEWTTVDDVTSRTFRPGEDDIGSYLRVTTTYSDLHGPRKTVSTATTEVVVANTAPRFATVGPIDFVILEHTDGAPDRSVGEPVVAADRDGDSLTYSLAGEDADLFVIDPSTTQIMLADGVSPDYEERSSYSLRILVLDGRDINANEDDAPDDSIDVAVIVRNVEEAGIMTPSLTNPRVGAPFSVSITDPDGQITNVEWKWERSPSIIPSQQTWAPIAEAGTSSFSPRDIDSGHYLRASATYTDGHGPHKTLQIVSAEPVLDFVGPIFVGAAGSVIVTVDENAPVGAVVGAPVTAESGVGGVTYSLSGLDAALFTIDKETGQIRVADGSQLDYESFSSSYSVTIVATDREKSNDSVTLMIELTNVSLPGVADLYDINHDERISRGEALSAIDDYFRGTITKDDAAEVIALH